MVELDAVVEETKGEDLLQLMVSIVRWNTGPGVGTDTKPGWCWANEK